MDLVSRLEGYLNHQIAYPNPIPVLPPAKTLHDKQDTTLLQMAMKAFLKQRLYGRFHNFDKDNTHNKNHINSKSINSKSINSKSINSKSINSKSISSSKIKNPQLYQSNKTTQIIRKNKNYSALQPVSTQYDIKKQLNKSIIKQIRQKQKIQQKRLHQISSSFDFKNKKLSQSRSVLGYSKKDKSYLSSLNQSFDIKNMSKITKNEQSKDEYPMMSFISQIGHDYEQEKNNKNITQSFKLPDINEKRKNMVSKLDKKQKTYLKKQNIPQCNINDQFWSYISKSKNQRVRRVKQSKLNQNNSKSIDLDNSINNSIIRSSIQNQQRNKNILISILKDTQNIYLNKQRLISYINKYKLSITQFMMHVINFFQFMAKINDKCKKFHFNQLVTNLYNLPDRAWSVAIFRYLDTNNDAQIDSSDIFKIHNIIDSLISKIQQDNRPNKSSKNQDQSIIYDQNKYKNHKRQKTKQSQVQNKDKYQNKSKIQNTKQKTNQSERQNPQNTQIINKFTNQNLTNLNQLKQQIQNLNSIIRNKDRFFGSVINKYQQDQINNDPQPTYLQEALLNKKQLKISDLNLILSDLSNQNGKGKKKVIDIDYRNMNIKLSSSYVQTFIATNHNDQTRMNRQYLQSLKDNIKNRFQQNLQPNKSLQKTTLPSIRYPEFYQSKLYLPIKQLFFKCLHTEVIQPK